MPTQDDQIETVEQLRLFNQEYEIYEKKIMYGVDIISVLNKAKSNNEKYVEGKFLNGAGYSTDYIINIVVTFKNPLIEKINVYYLENTTTGVETKEYVTGEGPKNGTIYAKDVFKKPSATYQNKIYSYPMWDSLKLVENNNITTHIEVGTYQLLAGKGEPMSSVSQADHPDPKGYTHYENFMIEGYAKLKEILTQSSNMTQTVKNKANELGEGTWSKAIWYPAVYDLKTKKFKCNTEKTVYSAKTGRIVYMEFTEI